MPKLQCADCSGTGRDQYGKVCENCGGDGSREISDPINHPPHYTGGGIECIDAMIAAQGIPAVINYCRCAAFKYLWRGGKKDDTVQDLRKSVWYIEKEIELRGRL